MAGYDCIIAKTADQRGVFDTGDEKIIVIRADYGLNICEHIAGCIASACGTIKEIDCDSNARCCVRGRVDTASTINRIGTLSAEEYIVVGITDQCVVVIGAGNILNIDIGVAAGEIFIAFTGR